MISSFKRYLVEEEKTVYFTFGRMNPPTIGHEKLLQSLAKQAGNNPYKIYLSNTQDSTKNPLPYKEKIKFARKMFPRYARQIIMDTSSRNIFDILTKLYDDGFKNVAMVVGSDRLREFNILLNKYNGKKARHGFYNFNKINVLSAGDRDPDADGAKGMSASKMRSAASSNDFTSFSQGLPKGVSNPDAKALYNAVRKGMGLKEQKHFKNHIQLNKVSDIRESYVNGTLYNIGDQVYINGSNKIATVKHLGANYVILDEQGHTSRKWLKDVSSVNEKITTRQDPDIADKKGTQPAKYQKPPPGMKKFSKSTKAARDAQFKKQAKMADDNPAAYKDAPGDKEARKKGMPISKYTKFTNRMLNQSDTPSEITVGNYTTKYYYMCPSAKKAMTKHSDVKGAEELTRLQDDYFKFEEQFINNEPTVRDKVKAQKMYDQIIQKAKQAGIEKDIDSYMTEHRDSIIKGDPKPGFGKVNEDAVKMARDRIEREKERIDKRHTRMLNRATLRKAINKNRERLNKSRMRMRDD